MTDSQNRLVKARGVKKSNSDVTPPLPTPAAGSWPTFNFGGSATEKKDEEPSKEGFKFEALTPIEPTPLPPIPKFDFKFEFGASADKEKEKKSEASSALQPATFAFEYKPIEFNFNFDKKEEPSAFEQKEELGEKRDYAGIIKATQDQTKVLGENVAPPSEPVLVSVSLPHACASDTCDRRQCWPRVKRPRKRRPSPWNRRPNHSKWATRTSR